MKNRFSIASHIFIRILPSPTRHSMRDYDSLSVDWRVCQAMLFLNAVWDLLSTACIWISFGSKYSTTQPTTSSSHHEEKTEPQASTSINTSTSSASGTVDEETAPLQNTKFTSTGGHSNNTSSSCQKEPWLFIAEMHTSLWISKEHSTSYSTNILFGWWIFTLGWIRLFACLDSRYISLAALSYAVEGCFFLTESFKHTMLPKKSFYVSVLSFLCMLLCVIKTADPE